ncbi:MAG: ribosomal L7Ae/L30e/S12e/Gadd45 family protein [Thermaerobacter sp.]|nr:ribosomal L7Ae/L30e/S12e/Gadd45 family protein [Thermaerobacter sp.]
MSGGLEGYLGLAHRAGQLVGGDAACRDALKAGAAKLVLLAGDAGSAVGRTFRRLAAQQDVPVRRWGSKESLGRATGSRPRAVWVVRDPGLAEVLCRLLDENGGVVR